MSSTVSRVLYQMIIYLDCMLPCSSFVPKYKTRHTRKHDGPPYRFLFCLAPSGVYTASYVTARAVVSYTAIPPLPAKPAVSFLLHWPSGRPDRTLSGTLPCGARTFLTRKGAIICATLLYPSTKRRICKGRISEKSSLLFLLGGCLKGFGRLP